MKKSAPSAPAPLQEQAKSILQACLELTALRREDRARRVAKQHEDVGFFGGGK